MDPFPREGLFGVLHRALSAAFRPKSPEPRMPKPPKRRKPPRNKGGGSETVLVEPDRPKLGSGGAEAPLEFDDRV